MKTFIGTNLVERLLREQNEVICIDDFTLGKQFKLRWTQYFYNEENK
ncbi:hypothetical protein AGMMS49940_18050 [Spirochaetia bacterium]|nr:hypothetical protein AGMMS49940_18050 [Spirochaetia bacterium]